jgi:transposase
MKTVKVQDVEWMKIQAFVRACPQVKMGSARQCRRFVEGVLWVLRSGAQWRWCDTGVWEQMFAHFAHDPDMENVMIDSTIVRAPLARKKSGGQPAQALGPVVAALAPKSTSWWMAWATRCALP